MKYYIITGSSKGLGKAIAQKILVDPNSSVLGISRNKTIDHPRYNHVFLDLGNLSLLKDSLSKIFLEYIDADRIVLINNAGIGHVGYLGNIDNNILESVLDINFIAPSILMNEFIRKYKLKKYDKLVINISSGAAKRGVDGWSAYCSSKAALDMITVVASLEEKHKHHNFKFYSIAPGIVDTDMQTELRKAAPGEFSRLEEFINYKKERMLESADKIADKYIYFIENTEKFKEPILSVRDFQTAAF